MSAPEYRKAYERAQRELTELLVRAHKTNQRILTIRKNLQTLAELCEGEGVDVEPSHEAAHLLENTNLADEVRAILKSAWPEYIRPHQVKNELERLGHDLSKYQNPQATIQMVLKRMTESGNVEEGTIPEDGKKTYRICTPSYSILGPGFAKALAELQKNPAFNPEFAANIAAAAAKAMSQMEKEEMEKRRK